MLQSFPALHYSLFRSATYFQENKAMNLEKKELDKEHQ